MRRGKRFNHRHRIASGNRSNEWSLLLIGERNDFFFLALSTQTNDQSESTPTDALGGTRCPFPTLTEYKTFTLFFSPEQVQHQLPSYEPSFSDEIRHGIETGHGSCSHPQKCFHAFLKNIVCLGIMTSDTTYSSKERPFSVCSSSKVKRTSSNVSSKVNATIGSGSGGLEPLNFWNFQKIPFSPSRISRKNGLSHSKIEKKCHEPPTS